MRTALAPAPRGTWEELDEAAAPHPGRQGIGGGARRAARSVRRALGAIPSRSRSRLLIVGALLLAGKALLPAMGELVGPGGEEGATALAKLAFVLAALIALGPIGKRALAGLRARTMSIDLLVTIAALGALVLGEAWEAGAVTFLFLLGHALEEATLASTRSALDALVESLPATALVLRDGRRIEVPASQVKPGDAVIVADGARIPVDGEVIEGAGSVDEAGITGEPLPREVGVGDSVHAGTLARGTLLVEARRVGAETTLAAIVARVEDAQNAKARIHTVMERFAAFYTPAIVLGALLVALFARDARLALTLLVISCPGALVISIPVASVAGIGAGAKRGILIRGGDRLEAAASVDVVAIDKTGTLTRGRPVVTGRVLASHSEGRKGDEAGTRLLALAAAIELASGHPLAEAVLEAARESGIRAEEGGRAEAVESLPGRGMRGVVDGRRVLVGSARFLAEEGVAVDEGVEGSPGPATRIHVAEEGVHLGALLVRDELRPQAREFISRLRGLGVRRVVMLTGDREGAARAVGEEVGVDETRAGLLPEDKLAAIEELRRSGGRVAMIGDGVNDAPALASADLGIAIGASGSGLAIEAADLAVLGEDLRAVADGLALARRTARIMRINLAIALAVVALLVAGVVLGEVTMALGMLVHEASVLLVILNALTLLRGGGGRRP